MLHKNKLNSTQHTRFKLKKVEIPGFEPGASHMRSERSTTELYSPDDVSLCNNQEHKKQIEEKGHAKAKQTQSTKTQTIKQSKQNNNNWNIKQQ